MDHWVGKKIPNNATIILDSNCSDELLGVSIKEGFKRCVNLKV
ncbi:hypothetical protein M983_3271 [Proteus myxofaciens ATCC 19692]|uniref:Uncharacterized protein n=1 Tax=Proteus myxofaciens ATCC 19692 TaxID=1354337 RepID=A0A198ESL0_9GAMM|nr:hypothetical protein M983_3271 [Proteus myxofaciens ATCC 19692]